MLACRNIGVRGDLLQWARREQGLTMRWVHNHGGPCLSYQSEVEHGKKREVRSELLATWVELLNVTVSFARGQIPVYREAPAACRGLAGEVGAQLMADPASLNQWQEWDPATRVREVLRMVARKSTRVPRVVLAHVLSLNLQTLDEMLLGTQPILQPHVDTLADLTALPPTFFTYGELGPVLQEGLSPAALEELCQYVAFLPALREARQVNMNPYQLAGLVRQQAPGAAVR